jgi:hypothetical protein
MTSIRFLTQAGTGDYRGALGFIGHPLVGGAGVRLGRWLTHDDPPQYALIVRANIGSPRKAWLSDTRRRTWVAASFRQTG